MTNDRPFGEGERSLFLKVLSAHIFALNAAADAMSKGTGTDAEVVLSVLLRKGLNRARTASPQILENACKQMLHLVQTLSPDESD